mmetsp:Transcript_61277/g.146047  ORF Transcript_61277/g.146047 Transcript_61277/m.146047 type:complete len:248 (-) Transcript_61277:498-1241(-)
MLHTERRRYSCYPLPAKGGGCGCGDTLPQMVGQPGVLPDKLAMASCSILLRQVEAQLLGCRKHRCTLGVAQSFLELPHSGVLSQFANSCRLRSCPAAELLPAQLTEPLRGLCGARLRGLRLRLGAGARASGRHVGISGDRRAGTTAREESGGDGTCLGRGGRGGCSCWARLRVLVALGLLGLHGPRICGDSRNEFRGVRLHGLRLPLGLVGGWERHRRRGDDHRRWGRLISLRPHTRLEFCCVLTEL